MSTINICEKARSILARQSRFAQKSKEWYASRYAMLTSSDVAAALDCNLHQSSLDLLKQKCAPISSSLMSNATVQWGERFEPVAREIFTHQTGEPVEECSLITHDKYRWLGASPDGVLLRTGSMLEIKCPYHRQLTSNKIPYYYWIQVQIQMEVCDVSECYFFQCSFENTLQEKACSSKDYAGRLADGSYWILKKHTLNVIKRDKAWFNSVIGRLEAFWEKVKHYREYGLGKLMSDIGNRIAYYNLETGAIEDAASSTTQHSTTQPAAQPDVAPLTTRLPYREDNLCTTTHSANMSPLALPPPVAATGANLSGMKRKASCLTDSAETPVPRVLSWDTAHNSNSSPLVRNISNSSMSPLTRNTTVNFVSPLTSDPAISAAIPVALPVAIPVAIPARSVLSVDTDIEVIESHPIASPTAPTNYEMKNWDEWVSATAIKNYMMDDPILDYLKYHGNRDPAAKRARRDIGSPVLGSFNPSSTYYQDKGVDFEKAVISSLYKQFQEQVITIADPEQVRDEAKFRETIAAMEKGIPIIYQGVLYNKLEKIYGMPDLIIRSDYLNLIFKSEVISKKDSKHKCKFSDRYHYRIIDCKNITLPFRSDGKHLLNSGLMAASKAQIYVYNKCLASIQNYDPETAYVLGCKWRYTTKGEKIEGDGWLDKAGVIDYSGVDRETPLKTVAAINWVRRVKNDGGNWVLNPPSVVQLYPNMKNTYDEPYRYLKSRLADDLGEITALWNCGVKNRLHAMQQDIKSWRDARCTAAALGIKGAKQGPALDAILNINRSNEVHAPAKITTRLPEALVEFFIDFETVNDLAEPLDDEFCISYSDTFLFMIGVGWRTAASDTWHYECFTTKKIDFKPETELEMLERFHSYIDGIVLAYHPQTPLSSEDPAPYVMYHWSHAEPIIYRKIYSKYRDQLKYYTEINWYDLLTVFRNEKLVINGALNYSLKSIVKALHRHGIIKTKWEADGIADGQSAMAKAIQCAKEADRNRLPLEQMPVMKSIMRYNETDCKVLLELRDFLHSIKAD